MSNIPENITKFFSDFIEKELGIVLFKQSPQLLENRLDVVAKNMQLDSVEALYQLAQSGIEGHFKQLLLDLATNNETYFFRDPKLFTFLAEEYIPKWLKDNPTEDTLTFWCCACSTGQEPLSLAIMYEEIKDKLERPFNIKIYATDISQRALDAAKEGKYSQLQVQRGLSSIRMIKNFKKDADDYWTIKDEVKKHLDFSIVNLLSIPSSVHRFDIILCRHVLIYQDIENKRKIIGNLAGHLQKDGILVLGGSEGLNGFTNGLEIVTNDSLSYLKLSDSGIELDNAA